MAAILYIQQMSLPDEVRTEKICRSLTRSGHNVTVISRWLPGMAEREEFQGYTVVRVGFEKYLHLYDPIPYSPFWTYKINEIAEEIRPDCIISRDIFLTSCSKSVAKKYGAPLLNDMAEHYPAAMHGWRKYQQNFFSRLIVNTLRVPDFIEKASVFAANGIIVVCEEQVERLHKQYGFPKELMSVVHNTPEIAELSILPNDFSGNITFAHHGYCTQQRNLNTFLRGFAIAYATYPHIRAEFIGEGETMPELRAIVSEIGNSCFCSSSGYRLAELPALLSRASIGVIPYKDDEFINHTISNKVFDYLAAGRPIFTSNAKPLKRIVEETQAGISWDCSTPESVAEGIAHILQSDLQKMSNNGRNWAKEKYNWSVDEHSLLEFLGRFCH